MQLILGAISPNDTHDIVNRMITIETSRENFKPGFDRIELEDRAKDLTKSFLSARIAACGQVFKRWANERRALIRIVSNVAQFNSPFDRHLEYYALMYAAAEYLGKEILAQFESFLRAQAERSSDFQNSDSNDQSLRYVLEYLGSINRRDLEVFLRGCIGESGCEIQTGQNIENGLLESRLTGTCEPLTIVLRNAASRIDGRAGAVSINGISPKKLSGKLKSVLAEMPGSNIELVDGRIAGARNWRLVFSFPSDAANESGKSANQGDNESNPEAADCPEKADETENENQTG